MPPKPAPALLSLRRSARAASPEEAEDEEDEPRDQGDMDETGRDLEGETDHPDDDQQRAEEPEHAWTPPARKVSLRGFHGLPARWSFRRDRCAGWRGTE